MSLPKRLDLSALGDLHAALLARRGQNIALDLSKVTHIGALCLQTLIAAARDARNSGHHLMLRNTSDRLLAQLHVLGVTPETIMEGQP